MKNTCKKIMSAILLCILIMSYQTIAFGASPITNPTTGWDTLEKDGILDLICMESESFKTALKNVMTNNSKTGLGKNYFNSGKSSYGDYWQCFGFAVEVSRKLFDTNLFPSNRTNDSSGLRGMTKFTYDSFVSHGIPQRGITLVRTGSTTEKTWLYKDGNRWKEVIDYENYQGDNKGHSMILLYYDKSYVYYLQSAKINGKYANSLVKQTWSEWTSGQLKNRKIKYVVPVSESTFKKKYPDAGIKATKLEFRDIVYPETFKINTSAGWSLSGGLIVSNNELKTLDVKIIKENDSKTVISQMATPRTLSGKVFSIKNLDGEGKDNGQKFSKISEEGKYIWIMTVTDSGGQSLTLEMPFTATKNNSTVTAKKSAPDNSQPTLTEKTLNAIYRLTKNDECRSGPAESYAKVKDLSEGTIVFVTASVVNQYNNTWYKLSDGSYVWDGDVEKVTLTETSASGEYQFIRDDESRKWPYEASNLVKSYTKGSKVTINAKVENTYNNIWYKLSDGSYVWSGDLELASGVQELQFISVKYPSNYKVGSTNGYIMSSGTLASNNQLKTITSTIKKSDGTVISGPKTRNISGYSYSIKSLDTMESGDNGVKFSKIKSAGDYVWILTATDEKNTLTIEIPFKASSSSTSESTKSKKLSDVNIKVTSVTLMLGEDEDEYLTRTNYGYDEDPALQLYAQVYPANATDSRIKWTSSNEAVLKLTSSENVENGGTLAQFSITGVGSTVITAEAMDGSGKKAVLDYHYYISGIELEALESEILVERQTSIIPKITPAIAGYDDLSWECYDPWVATVDAYGTVTGVSAGTATIAAMAKDGEAKATYIITVVAPTPPTLKSVSFDSNEVEVGTEVGITATTSTDAEELNLYAGNTIVQIWTEGYTDNGDIRTWKVPYNFSGAGNRTVSFTAENYVGESERKDASIVVKEKAPEIPTLSSVTFSTPSVALKNNVTITAVTSIEATKLCMYSEENNLVTTWTTGYTDNGSTRTWKVTYAFGGAGNRILTFKAGNTSGMSAGKSASITVIAAPTLSSVKFSKSSAALKENIAITAVTSTSATKLCMYSEENNLVTTWTTGYTDNGSTRTWKVTYAFNGAGNRTLTFKAGNTSGMSAGKSASITVNAAPALSSVAFSKSSAALKENVTITAVTSTSATKLCMYSEENNLVTTWTTGYTDSGSARTWKVTYAFSGAGKRTLAFKAGNAAGMSVARNATITVNAVPTLSSVKFGASSAVVKKNVTITAVTSTSATKLCMYSEENNLVTTWTTGYTDSGSARTWKVTYAFSGAGKRTLAFRAGNAAGMSSVQKASITVTNATVPTLSSVNFGVSSIALKKNATIIAVTSTSATKLCMYSEENNLVTTWTTGYTDSGSTRTWKVTYAFSGTGNRSLIFKAGNAAGLSAGKKATITVTAAAKVPSFFSVNFGSDSIKIKQKITIIAVTSTDATKLCMYSEDNKLVTTWTTGYTDSDGTRTWKVTYAFSGDGNRSLIFKAGNASGMSAGKKATIKVTK